MKRLILLSSILISLSALGADYGYRNDGSLKGKGYLGELTLSNGGIATEYTIGVNIGGVEMDIPTIVPTLNRYELQLLTDSVIPNSLPIPDSIVNKAILHAVDRINSGQSVFVN